MLSGMAEGVKRPNNLSLSAKASFWIQRQVLVRMSPAAITYLASLVPGFSDALKYVVMAGAVTGGGLTVIANSPKRQLQKPVASEFSRSIERQVKVGAIIYLLLFGAHRWSGDLLGAHIRFAKIRELSSHSPLIWSHAIAERGICG
jgi:hypothetical protein